MARFCIRKIESRACSVLLNLAQLVQVRPQELRAVDIVARVELFVHRVRTVVTTANREEEDVQVEDVGKVKSDRDGAALTCVVRGLAVDKLSRLVRRTIRVVLY